MALCTHNHERSSIVSSNMTSTVYRSDCRDCGRCFYYTEEVVPGVWKEDPDKKVSPPKAVPTPARYFQPAPESKKGHQK